MTRAQHDPTRPAACSRYYYVWYCTRTLVREFVSFALNWSMPTCCLYVTWYLAREFVSFALTSELVDAQPELCKLRGHAHIIFVMRQSVARVLSYRVHSTVVVVHAHFS